MTPHQQEALKSIPQVQSLLESKRGVALSIEYSRTSLLDALRVSLDQLRLDIKTNEAVRFEETTFFERVASRLVDSSQPNLRRVINGTGIVLHTNLGRAPLAEEAIEAIAEVSRGYSNLEMDLESGERGSRYSHVESLLVELTGAEAALVVNNNAAAVVLALNTFAPEGEVVVSRGELIEIGGSFRIPDVIERGGARLVEVGSTNKTHAKDYKNAITDDTRVLLKVHTSNFRVVGFTSSVDRADVVSLAHEHGLIAMEDLGSGTLVDPADFGLAHETTIGETVRSGMDLVTFSGDKLLGGPQAGVIVGNADAVARMKRNPLLRAFRIDKLSLAALEATLRVYREKDEVDAVPFWKMMRQSMEVLHEKAERLKESLGTVTELNVVISEGDGYAGGGSLPGEEVPTWLVHVRHERLSTEALGAELRTGTPSVMGRIVDDAFVLDVRTIDESEFELIHDRFESVSS